MRWYRFLAPAMVILLLLSACASSGAPAGVAPTGAPPDSTPGAVATTEPAQPDQPDGSPESVVTIGFAAQQVERQVYEPLISAFNAQNPGIHVQFVSLDDVIEAGDAANAGPTELMRRVVSAADTSVFFLTSEGIRNKYVQNLKPFMDADATFDSADYYPGALELFQQGDGIYAMPHTLSVPLLSYNKDLWAARGLAAPKPDASWSDLSAFAEQLAQRRGDKVDTYGIVDQQGGVMSLNAELAASGTNIVGTPREQLQLDRPEVATAVKHVVDLIKSGAIYVQPQIQGTPGQAQQLILDKRVGLWPLGAVFDGPKDDPAPGFEVGTVAFPSPALPFSGSPQAFMMSPGTQHQLESWRWLSFLSHQQIARPTEHHERVDRVPARKSVAEKSGYWSKLDTETKAAIEAALAHPTPTLDAFDTPAVQLIGRVLTTAMQGTQPVEQVLHDAQATLDQQVASVPTATPDQAPIIVAPQVPDVAPPGATTIIFSSLGLGSDQTRRIVQEFNQANNGVFVKLRSIDLSRQRPQLADMTGSSDCFDWFGPPGSDTTGLLDLQPLADADSSFQLADYPAALLAPFKRSGALYGLPYKVDFRVLAYNQSAFDSAGLPHPIADWTPEDFLNTAQKLTSGSGANKVYGFVAPDDQSEPLLFFMRRFGASPVRGSTGAQQPNFNDPAVIQAIRFYMELLRTASPHTRLGGYGGGQQDDSFLLTEQGQAGMWFTYGLDPDIFRGQDFTVAIAPPPLGTSQVSADDLRVSGLYISANSQHPEACWTWLKYLSGAVAGLAVGFPARSSVAESQAFVDQAPPGALDVYKAYRAAFERAPGGAAQQSLAQSQIDLYWFFRAVDRALQGKDLERELADAQTITEQYLACVQGGASGGTCARQVDPSYQGASSATPVP